MRALPKTPLEEQTRDERLEGDVSSDAFDRVAFAEEALSLLRPKTMTVAVCGGAARLSVQRGRAWGRGEGAEWALVTVPNDASRRAIALALTALVPRREAAPHPYRLDVLLAETAERAS